MKPYLILGGDTPDEGLIFYEEGETAAMSKWIKYHPNYSFISKREATKEDLEKYDFFSENLQIIKEEFNQHKGEIVLTESHKLERFIGIGTDDQDYYWITYNGRETTWNTCVGGLIYLKGKIDDKDYENLVRQFKLNHQDMSEMFPTEIRKKAKEEMSKVNGKDKVLTEICFEIN